VIQLILVAFGCKRIHFATRLSSAPAVYASSTG
jgi:hypothetical protein